MFRLVVKSFYSSTYEPQSRLAKAFKPKPEPRKNRKGYVSCGDQSNSAHLFVSPIQTSKLALIQIASVASRTLRLDSRKLRILATCGVKDASSSFAHLSWTREVHTCCTFRNDLAQIHPRQKHDVNARRYFKWSIKKPSAMQNATAVKGLLPMCCFDFSSNYGYWQ